MEAVAPCDLVASGGRILQKAANDMDDAEKSRSSECTLDDAFHAMRTRRKTRRVVVEIAVERTDGGEASAQGNDTRKVQQVIYLCTVATVGSNANYIKNDDLVFVTPISRTLFT